MQAFSVRHGRRVPGLRPVVVPMEASQRGRAYLDWNATAPLRAQARAAMLAALELVGNPSSVHAEGRAARRAIEQARAQVAAWSARIPADVVFTSGGTEANATGLVARHGLPAPATPGFDRLLVSAIEHPSVCAGRPFRDRKGCANSGDRSGDRRSRRAASCAAGSGRPLVSVMLANNETGVIQPIRDVADLVHEAGCPAACRCGSGAGPDCMSISMQLKRRSSDDFRAQDRRAQGRRRPGRGARALHLTEPLIRGGGQERGLRAGTENVAAIAGFGAAAEAAGSNLAAEAATMRRLRDRLEAGLRAATPDSRYFRRKPGSGCRTPSCSPIPA